MKYQRWCIALSSKQVVSGLLHDLLKYFAANDLGELHYFLGTKVRRIPKGIVHTLQKYVFGLIKKATMVDCKPLSTPLSTSEKIAIHEVELLGPNAITSYRSVV